MAKGQPRALELLRRRQQRAANPTQREKAAWNNFYASASPKDVAIPEIPKARAPRTPSNEPSEHQEQVAVCQWWFQACKLYKLPPIVLMAIPNAQILMGSAVHPERVMQYLRAEGFRVGAPDLFLAASGDYEYGDAGGRGPTKPGLFIELKRAKGGTQSVEQINFQTILREQGYRAELCHGADAAIAVIKEYLA